MSGEHPRDGGEHPRDDGERHEDRGPGTRGPRRFAEWLTFGVSLALVLAVFAHLAWRMAQPTSNIVPVEVTPRLERVAAQGERFVLPVEIQNRGERALRDVQVRIEYREREQPEDMDVLVDYVGQSATQTVFVYFREDPRRLSVRAAPMAYRLE